MKDVNGSDLFEDSTKDDIKECEKESEKYFIYFDIWICVVKNRGSYSAYLRVHI